MKKILYYLSLYKRQVILSFGVLAVLLGTICFIFINNRFNSEIEEDKSILVTNIPKKDINLIKVDVKGAVNSPGVYEVGESDRVIDAINKAGGFSINAYQLNLNLAKRLKDEAVIIVNTIEEVDYYKLSKVPIVCENTNKLLNNGVCELYNIASLDNSDISSNVSNNEMMNTFVNINTASLEELSSLEGIGISKAEKILQYREKNNGFKDISELKNVEGIGDKLYDAIKDLIRV